jgi:hypothetical protein
MQTRGPGLSQGSSIVPQDGSSGPGRPEGSLANPGYGPGDPGGSPRILGLSPVVPRGDPVLMGIVLSDRSWKTS